MNWTNVAATKWIIITEKKGLIICEGGMPLGSLNSHTCISSPAETEISEDPENDSWNNASQLVEHSKKSKSEECSYKNIDGDNYNDYEECRQDEKEKKESTCL